MHGLTLPINEQVKQRIQSASAAQISVIPVCDRYSFGIGIGRYIGIVIGIGRYRFLYR